MSKFGGRPGHNEKCRGARGIVDEVTEDRPIFLASKKYLQQKNEFVDCTPYHNPASQNEDLNYGINMANNNNVDLFYSTHLNKAYEKYEGKIGAEVWVYDRNSTKAIAAGTRVLKNLEALGFKNRGIKYMKEEKRQLGELMNTRMEAMIIECFFVEATEDVALYRRVGADAIGFAIASGIDPSIVKEVPKTAVEPKYYVETSYIKPEVYCNGLADFFNKDDVKFQIKSDAKGPFIQTMHMPLDRCNAMAYTFTCKFDIMAYVWKEDKITDAYGNITYSDRILI